MAKQTIISITDDLDGSPDATTVEFGYGGGMFTIDLAGKNLQQFHEFMERHAAAGELVRRGNGHAAWGNGHRPTRQQPGSLRSRRKDSAEVRDWWKANEDRLGLPAWKAKGNIPEAVRDAFRDR